MGNFSINRDVSGSYVFNTQTLEALRQHVETFVSTPTNIEVSYADGLNVTFASANEIEGNSNTVARLIKNISISGQCSNYKNRASIRISSGSSSPISISIYGDEIAIKSLYSKFIDELSAIKTWYSVLHYNFFTSMIPAMASIIIFAVSVTPKIKSANPDAFVIIFGGPIGLLVGYLQSKLLPQIEFGVGKGKRIHNWRWKALSVLASIFIMGTVKFFWDKALESRASMVAEPPASVQQPK